MSIAAGPRHPADTARAERIDALLGIRGSAEDKAVTAGGLADERDQILNEAGAMIGALGQACFIAPFGPDAGQFIANIPTGASLTTAASVANAQDISPFIANADTPIDQIGVSISAALAGNVAPLIFASDAKGRPSDLLIRAANIDSSTTGTKFSTVSFTFRKGVLYWIGAWSSAACTLRRIQSGIPITWTNAATPVVLPSLRRSVAYAASSPDWTYAAADHNAALPPAVLMRTK